VDRDYPVTSYKELEQLMLAYGDNINAERWLPCVLERDGDGPARVVIWPTCAMIDQGRDREKPATYALASETPEPARHQSNAAMSDQWGSMPREMGRIRASAGNWSRGSVRFGC
jgi:hypothetical protein